MNYHMKRARKLGLPLVPYKKLSYCWETVQRESLPNIAEMDVEMTTWAEMTVDIWRSFQIGLSFEVIKSGTNRKLLYDFL